MLPTLGLQNKGLELWPYLESCSLNETFWERIGENSPEVMPKFTACSPALLLLAGWSRVGRGDDDALTAAKGLVGNLWHFPLLCPRGPVFHGLNAQPLMLPCTNSAACHPTDIQGFCDSVGDCRASRFVSHGG